MSFCSLTQWLEKLPFQQCVFGRGPWGLKLRIKSNHFKSLQLCSTPQQQKGDKFFSWTAKNVIKKTEEKRKFYFQIITFFKKKGKSHFTGELRCSKMSLNSLRDILILFMFWQNLWAADHFLKISHSYSYHQHWSKFHFIKQNSSGSLFKKKKKIIPDTMKSFSPTSGDNSWEQFCNGRLRPRSHHWWVTS